jgi:hypothetical protein
MQNDSITIEWAPFRARPGVTDDDVRAAAAAIQGEFLARQPGFLRRELLRAADGGYVDLLWWKDAASAEAAMSKVGDSPACARYFALMAGDPSDPSAVQHLTRVASY